MYLLLLILIRVNYFNCRSNFVGSALLGSMECLQRLSSLQWAFFERYFRHYDPGYGSFWFVSTTIDVGLLRLEGLNHGSYICTIFDGRVGGDQLMDAF